MADVIHVRGEGGAVYAMALPLQPDVAHRLQRGHLRRVTADGAPWLDSPEEPDTAVPSLPTERPALSAPKPSWVGWAVANGCDPDTAEALTKTDLVDRYGTTTA